MGHEDVLNFWFKETNPRRWWVPDAAFDRLLTERFGALHRAAVQCELYGWRGTPQGRLAEVIVIDQFSRNIHRHDARAFAHDSLALALAQEAVRRGTAAALLPQQRAFLYMPFMHSESREIHDVAMRLFSEPGLEGHLDYENQHKATIDRFGRYPQRNAILGRESTAAEIAFLRECGGAFQSFARGASSR